MRTFRYDVVVLVCVLLATALTLIYSRRPVAHPGNDQGAYVATGVSMAGGPPADYRGTWPPLFPFASSLFIRLGLPAVRSFDLTCLVSFLLLVLLLFRICRELGLGVTPVFVTVLCPAVFAYGWTEMSEMPCTILTLAALWAFLHARSLAHGCLAGVFVVLSYETRYIAEFLVPFMACVILTRYLAGRQVGAQIVAFSVGTLGIFCSMGINFWRYGYPAGPRNLTSAYGPWVVIHDLGVALWALWCGDGPMLKLGGFSWLVALLSLAALSFLLVKALQGDSRIKEMALAVICYLAVLTAAECTVPLDAVNRRLLVPTVPLLVVLCFHRIRNYPRLSGLAIAVSGLAAVAQVVHGRTF